MRNDVDFDEAVFAKDNYGNLIPHEGYPCEGCKHWGKPVFGDICGSCSNGSKYEKID